MKHYVCVGECRGVSNVPKTCGALGCHKYGHPLVECECEDRKHNETFEKKRKDVGEEKNNT